MLRPLRKLPRKGEGPGDFRLPGPFLSRGVLEEEGCCEDTPGAIRNS